MAHAPEGDASPEVLVIGGGPAGLAAALYLARFRRRVLLVDGGHSRAAKIPCSHNYPGFADGVAGSALLAAMRRQAQVHGVRMVSGEVGELSHRGAGFRARWTGGEAHAGKVVLATGVSDVPPAMPHLQQALQEGALRYCPVCDGYEVIGTSVGVVVDSGSDVAEALYLRHFSERLTVFLASPEVRFDAAQRRRLADAGIRLVEAPVDSIRLWEGRLTLRHGDTESEVDSLYGALGLQIHSRLATALGAEHERGYLLVDRQQQTSVPGLYAVGDVVKGLNQITVGVGEAAVAAASIQRALLGWA